MLGTMSVGRIGSGAMMETQPQIIDADQAERRFGIFTQLGSETWQELAGYEDLQWFRGGLRAGTDLRPHYAVVEGDLIVDGDVTVHGDLDLGAEEYGNLLLVTGSLRARNLLMS